LITTIALPAGYQPSETAAGQSTLQVVVISFTSADIQIIDASRDKLMLDDLGAYLQLDQTGPFAGQARAERDEIQRASAPTEATTAALPGPEGR